MNQLLAASVRFTMTIRGLKPHSTKGPVLDPFPVNDPNLLMPVFSAVQQYAMNSLLPLPFSTDELPMCTTVDVGAVLFHATPPPDPDRTQ
jgi:hypothetical protein